MYPSKLASEIKPELSALTILLRAFDILTLTDSKAGNHQQCRLQCKQMVNDLADFLFVILDAASPSRKLFEVFMADA
jgi:hypothetical protein